MTRLLLPCVLVAGLAAASAAASLHDRLRAITDPTGVTIPVGGASMPVTVPTTLDFDYIAPVVSRTALRAADRPVIAAAPSFVYAFDPHDDTFRRERVLAPIFAPRASTIGAGRIEIGATLDWSELDRVDGGGFGEAVGLTRTALAGPGSILLQRVRVDDFALRTLSLLGHVTVGITDRLDVSLLAPLQWTELSARVRQRLALFDADAALLGRSSTARRRTHGDAVGVGDVLARGTLLLWPGDRLRVASTLTIRLPTGDTADFQGLGDTVVTPGLSTSLSTPLAELNAGLGLDLNADDTERSRVRYVAGGTIPLREWFSLVVEVVGSSGLSADHFTVPGALRTVNGADLVAVDPIASRTELAVPRSDVVDLAVTGKIDLGGTGSLFLGVLVPLTGDGLRAVATPICGVDVTF